MPAKPRKMKCKVCGALYSPAADLGKIKSAAKSAAARINGLKGGRPKTPCQKN